MVREVDPPRPSTKVSTAEGLPNIAAGRSIDPAQLKRALTGDLDWIVMKALEKDRTRRYETANGFAADINRHLSSEPVLAAPPSRVYRTKKFVRKHRGGVLAASLVLLSLLGGLAAVAAVQTAANARLAASLTRETNANTALNEANGQLTKSRAAVEARYKLAMDAIKTFHTGVSEDFLLKEEKFKELRNRLLKSAADFYGKLGALLGKETDIASRRALAQSNFELADLTGKVGRNEDALAAHRAVLAAREALAAEPGAGVVAKVDVGRSLIAVAGLLEATGKTDEALATYRRSESLLAGPAGADPSARAALAACRSQMGWLLTDHGQVRRRPGGLPAGAGRPGGAGRRSRGLQRRPPRPGGHGPSASASCWGRRASRRRRRPSTAGRWRSTRSWPTTTPPSPNSAAAWRTATTTSASCWRTRASRRRRRPSTARRWRSTRSWPTTTPPSPNSAATWRAATTTSAGCCGTRASRRRRRPSSARRWRSTRSWPTTTPPSPNSAAAWRTATSTSASCCRTRASRRGGGRVPQGAGDSGRSWPTTTPPSPNSAAAWRTATTTSATCCRTRASRRRRRPSSARRWRSTRSWPTTTPPSLTSAASLAWSHRGLADLLSKTGKPAEAEAEYRKALAIRQKLADDNPADTDFRSGLADSHFNLGILLSSTGKPAEAEAEYRKALAIRQKLADDNPADTGFRSGLADSHFNLGILLSNTGKPAEAEAEYRKAVAIRQKLVDDNPSDIDLRGGLSYDYLRVAALQAWFGQDKELSSTCEKLLSLAKDTEDPELADKAAKCCSLRQADPKRCEAALVLARRAVEHGKGSQWLVYFEMALGMAEYRSGHFAEADAALTAAMNDPGKNNTVSSTSAFYRAMGLFRQGKTDLARKLATEAAAKMKPLPVDEQKPLLGGADAERPDHVAGLQGSEGHDPV